MAALPDAVDLNGLVAFGGHTQLARVVEVDRENVWTSAIFGFVAFEQLLVDSELDPQEPCKRNGKSWRTFVGLKLPMTSLTGEVALAFGPSVRVMFRCGASAGDASVSMSMGVKDIVKNGRGCAFQDAEQGQTIEFTVDDWEILKTRRVSTKR